MSVINIDSSDEEVSVKKNSLATKNEMSDDKYLDVLQKCFGHQRFRPMQWKIISSVLEKRDVCAIMATGYGKSLCYQFPSVYTDGITIVISPLISLMEDQVLALNMANIPSCMLGSAQMKQKDTIESILEGEYRIIYATPEFCLGDYGFGIMKQVQEKHTIDLLAIDEAHCVSKWGHDFRIQYRNLWKLRSILKGIPVLAVTATATPKVQQDICSSLKLKNPLNLCSGFDRPNLYFEVKLKTAGSSPYSDIRSCMSTTNKGLEFSGSTIIYCITKKSTEDVSKNLQGHGVKNVMYHAGLTIKQRKLAHENFVKDKIKVIVATIAFGMGIDKPDVRTVIHYGSSKDIESYYQEVGRAGRDGLPSKCIVFFSSADFTIFQHLRESTFVSNDVKKHKEESELLMEKYLNISECRRKFILDYFEDNISNYNKTKKNCCDNCTRSLLQPKFLNEYEGVDENGLYNYTNDAILFLKAVKSLYGKFGIALYCLFIRGSKSSKLSGQYQNYEMYGKGKHGSDEWWKIIARILTSEGFLQKNYQKKTGSVAFSYATVSLSNKGNTFLNEVSRKNIELKIEPPKDMKKHLKLKPTITHKQNDKSSSSWIDKSTGHANKTQSENSTTLTTNAEDPIETLHRTEIYKLLLETRNAIAHSKDVMPYLVASNTALMQMARLRPNTLEQMLAHAYDGLNEGKIRKFGQEFIDCILNYRETHSLESQSSSLSNIKSTSGNNSQQFINKNDANMFKVSDLKQFSYIEKAVIPATETSDIQEDDKINSDISDSEFNEILDKIETDLDETICETDENDKANKSNTKSNLCDDDKVENLSFNFLASPEMSNSVSSDVNNTTLLDEDTFDDCLMQAVDEIEINSAKKRRNSDHNVEWCQKKKKSTLSKFLDF